MATDFYVVERQGMVKGSPGDPYDGKAWPPTRVITQHGFDFEPAPDLGSKIDAEKRGRRGAFL